MKVFLICLADRCRVFYAEGAGDAPASAEPTSGVRGWFSRKYHGWRHAIQHPEGGMSRAMSRLWSWLRRFTMPDEPLLHGLRHADRIDMVLPAGISEDEARASWADYLAKRRRRHLIWLTLDALVCPLSVLLAPLPGPNVLGYWFLYRAACHLLALLGVSRAARLEVRVTPDASGLLDQPLADGDAVSRIARAHDLPGLAEFVERSTPAASITEAEPEPEAAAR